MTLTPILILNSVRTFQRTESKASAKSNTETPCFHFSSVTGTKIVKCNMKSLKEPVSRYQLKKVAASENLE